MKSEKVLKLLHFTFLTISDMNTKVDFVEGGNYVHVRQGPRRIALNAMLKMPSKILAC